MTLIYYLLIPLKVALLGRTWSDKQTDEQSHYEYCKLINLVTKYKKGKV